MSNDLSNAQLKSIYDAQYAAGYQSQHTCDTWEESLLIHRLGGDWRGKRVLEIGCGEGRLAALLAANGADVWGLDYSRTAIEIASERYRLPDLYFEVRDDRPLEWQGDVVVMQGVLEHTDDWRATLSECLDSAPVVITSSPSFLNPRGYIWQALRLLLGVPMSLTDLHYICPPDMEAFAREHGYRLHYESCHHDWACGATLLADYAQRLPNALRDAGLPTERVPQLLAWLEQLQGYYVPTAWSGANVVYRLER